MKSKLLLFALLSISLFSCYKDSEVFTERDPITTPINNLQEFEGKILGYVYNEDNQPVANAQVDIYSGSTTTDDYGVFVFDNQKMDPNGTYIKVTKDGYMLGSDLVYPIEGTIQSSIQMFSLNNDYAFNAGSGGDVDISEGGKLIFPAGAIVDQNGIDFSGLVKVSAHYLNPNDKDLGDKMPGGLFGLDKDGIHQVLGTLGMMAVELRDESGNELEIKSGMSVNLQFPAPDIAGSLPANIPLWSFDEDRGLWIEEGTAVLEGDHYVAEVSHFSFWNCDAPFPLVHICGSVYFTDQTPAANYRIKVIADGLGAGYGIVDEKGQFCGKMPKNQVLNLLVINPVCEEIIAEKSVGPFSSDDEIESITIDKNIAEISGTVLCDSDKLAKANIVIKAGEKTLLTTSDVDGAFSYVFDNTFCSDITAFEIFAYNSETGEASSTKEYGIEDGIGIMLNVCSSCEFEVAITESLEDPCDQQNKTLTADVTGATNLAYAWSNGSDGQSTKVSSSGVYCVTVTNTDEGCDMVTCKEIEVKQNLADSSFVFYTDCSVGKIELMPIGGVPPYEFFTEGPNGYTNTDDFMDGLEPGVYVTTITDSENCETIAENVVEEGGSIEVSITAYNSCNEAYLQVGRDQTNVFKSYEWSTGEKEPFITVETDGQYCVTVTDEKGCAASECIDVVIPNIDYNLLPENCENNIYTINIPDPNLILNIYINGSDPLELERQTSFDFNVLENGFGFSYFGYTADGSNGECQFESFVQLPQFKGLSIGEITNTTCDGCEDGKIDFVIESGADCIDCSVGTTAIYAKEDLTTDLSSANDAGTLGAGQYYVVVKDADSGCIIAYDLVKIE